MSRPGAGPELGQSEQDHSLDVLVRRLHACQYHFHNYLQAHDDGVLIVAHDGRVVLVNPAAEALFNRPATELTGAVSPLQLAAGMSRQVHLPSAAPGDPPRLAQLRVLPTVWEDQPAHLATLRPLFSAEPAGRDEFLALLSHELRNPLAPIRNALHLMRKSANLSLHSELQETITRQFEILARLLDDLLDITRLSTGKITLRRQSTDLSALARAAVDAIAGSAESRTITLDAPDPLPLEADPIRLQQAIDCLLRNAVKFTDPTGTICVTTERVDQEHVLKIRDDGLGIEPDSLHAIFEPFVQTDSALDHDRTGLGVGLTLARNLVHLHGGSIHAESEGQNQGAQFTIRLPDRNPANPTCQSQSPDSATSAQHDTRATSANPLRVLVVDDNVDSARSISLLIGLWGHEVETAHDGPEAIDLAARFQPSVALLDIGLPRMDGYELAFRLRQQAGSRPLLLIAMTGYGQEEDRARSLATGFDHHLVKPVNLVALEQILAEQATRLA